MTLRKTILLSLAAHLLTLLFVGNSDPGIGVRRGSGPIVIVPGTAAGTGPVRAVRPSPAPRTPPVALAQKDNVGLPSAAPAEAAGVPAASGLTDGSDIGIAPPIYPELARLRGEQGPVLLELQLDAHLRLGSVAVMESSGYPLLDRAALAAVRGSLVPSDSTGPWLAKRIRVVFQLK